MPISRIIPTCSWANHGKLACWDGQLFDEKGILQAMLTNRCQRREVPVKSRRYFLGAGLEALEGRRLLAVGDFLGSLANPNTTQQYAAETGHAVSAHGDLVAISAPQEDLFGLSNVGQVHIYDRTTDSLVRSIPNPTPNSGDRFGEAIALHGTTLVVGTRFDDATGIDSGQAAAFDVTTGQLLHLFENPSPSDSDFFGSAVNVQGDKVVVGAYFDDADGMNAGSAYVFDLATGGLLYELTRPAPNAGDNFGTSISIDGNRVAVGVPRSSVGAGSVELFALDTGTFDRSIANPVPANFDFFGFDVGLSNDTVLISAYSDNTGDVNSGTAYLFDAASGSLVHTLNNPAPELADNFGYSVAIEGDTVLVGAYRDNAGANDAGTVYEFSAASGILARTISNPDPQAFDFFGVDVAVAGASIVVGARGDDTSVEDAGAAYFFEQTTGNLTTTFFTPTPSSYDFFGQAVAVSGDLIAVGTTLDDTGAIDTGSVQVYESQAQTLRLTIANPTPDSGDNFGGAVAMSSEILVVGAPRDDTSGADSGIAYVFNASSGALLHTLANPTPAIGDNFGTSVTIDGSLVVVGAPGDDTGATNSGSVYVFDAGNGVYLGEIANPSPNDFDAFGAAIDISGDLLVAGSRFDDTMAVNAGVAYVFDAPTRSLTTTLTDSQAAKNDLFGQAVAIAGTTVAIGSPQKDAGAVNGGAVHMFNALTGAQTDTIISLIPATDGFFGESIAINDQVLAVGSNREDSQVPDSGAAYIFDVTTGNHIQRLEHPSPSRFDNFGFSIAVDNHVLAVGAPLVDGSTVDRGEVLLFAADNNTAPVANPGGPYSFLEGEMVSLNASNSSDEQDDNADMFFRMGPRL